MRNSQTKIERIIFTGIIFLLVFAPLAFGSVYTGAYTIVELIIFTMLALWGIDRLFLSKNNSIKLIKTPLNLFFLLILTLIVIQLIPLPPFLIKLISSVTYSDKINFYNIDLSGANFKCSKWMTISYYCHASIQELFKLISYMGMFFLVIHTVKTKKQINILIYVIILTGLFEAFCGIFQGLSGISSSCQSSHNVSSASGTYCLSGHFAGYLEIIIPLTLGFIIANSKKKVPGLKKTILSKFRHWMKVLTVNNNKFKMIFLILTAFALMIAFLLSSSQHAVFSLSISILLVSFLFFFNNKYKFYGTSGIFLCIFFLLCGLHIVLQSVVKLSENPGNQPQTEHLATASMFSMIQDYPFLGIGQGNLKYLYSRYAPDDTSSYPHNEWIEYFVEMGIGGFFILTGMLYYIFRVLRQWCQRNNLYSLGISSGVLAGILSLAFHSYFDFNMHITAIPLTLAATAALAFLSLYIVQRKHGKFFYRTRKIILSQTKRRTAGALIIIFWLVSINTVINHFLAEALCPTEISAKPKNATNLIELKKALSYNSDNAEYYFKIARYYMEIYTENPELKKDWNEIAITNLEKAIQLNPANAYYWFYLGKTYSFKNYDNTVNYLNQWLPMAEKCFDQALAYSPYNDNILFDTASYWVWRSRMLPEEQQDYSIYSLDYSLWKNKILPIESIYSKSELPNIKNNSDNNSDIIINNKIVTTRAEGINKFQERFKKYLKKNKKSWKKAVDRVCEYYREDSIVIGIVPENDNEMQTQVLRMILTRNYSQKLDK
ncbi:ABC-2 type transport system permease protein [Candidatus Magnetomoraceae bacterium gMMP-13]